MTDPRACMVSRNPRPKFTKFGEHVSVGQTPNLTAFTTLIILAPQGPLKPKFTNLCNDVQAASIKTANFVPF